MFTSGRFSGILTVRRSNWELDNCTCQLSITIFSVNWQGRLHSGIKRFIRENFFIIQQWETFISTSIFSIWGSDDRCCLKKYHYEFLGILRVYDLFFSSEKHINNSMIFIKITKVSFYVLYIAVVFEVSENPTFVPINMKLILVILHLISTRIRLFYSAKMLCLMTYVWNISFFILWWFVVYHLIPWTSWWEIISIYHHFFTETSSAFQFDEEFKCCVSHISCQTRREPFRPYFILCYSSTHIHTLRHIKFLCSLMMFNKAVSENNHEGV